MTKNNRGTKYDRDSVVDEQQLSDVVADYIERLTHGEKIEPEEVLAEYPTLGPLILEELEAFVSIGEDVPFGDPLPTLGDYTLRNQIGRGGMGVVYDAWQNSMDRRVALKVLPSGVAADNTAFMRFMREAKTAGQLNHQNVVGVFGMGVEAHTPYYAMEFVEGETLSQILSRFKDANLEVETPFGKSDETEFYSNIASSFADVADGLQHAHSKGVIHRDVKPSNLILDYESRLRILDFGLARLEGQEGLTLTGDVMGTPSYMSPEQAKRHQVQIDHRTDIYSLGATLYEMLTHEPPFRGKDSHDTLSKIIAQDPRSPRQLNNRVPVDLETVALKCLRKEPSDRYRTAEAVGQDLRRFVRGDPIEARPESRWEWAARRLGRARGKLVLMGTILCLLSTVGWLSHKNLLTRHDQKLRTYRQAVRQAAVQIYEAESELRNEIRPLSLPSPRFERLARLIETLEELVSAVPEKPEGHYYLARLHLLLREVEQPALVLKRGLKAQYFVPSAVLLWELENPSQRASKFDRVWSETLARGGWEAAWLRARRASYEENWAELQSAYRELVSYGREGELYTGSSLEFRLARGVASLRAQDFADAISQFAAARGESGEFVGSAILLGKAWYLLGEPIQAEQVFKELYTTAIESERNNIALWIMAAYESVDDREKSGQWKQHLRGAPAHRIQGFGLWVQGKWRDAEAAFREALRIDPEDAISNVGMALTLIFDTYERYGPARDREYQLARQCAEKAARFFSFAQVLLAATYVRENDPAAARSLSQRWATLAANDLVTDIVYANVLVKEGEWKAAEEQTRRIAARAKNASTFHEVGYLFEQLHKFQEATDSYREAAERGGHANTYAQLARALIRLGDYERAIEACHRALAGFPRNTGAYENLAFALWKLGHPEDALDWTAQGIKELPDRARLHLLRGLILKSANRPHEARSCFNEALQYEQFRRDLPFYPEYEEVETELGDFLESYETKEGG